MRDEFTVLIMIVLLIMFLAIGFIALLVDIYLVLDEEIFSVSCSTGFISHYLNVFFYTPTNIHI